MKRCLLMVLALASMAGVAAIALQDQGSSPELDLAARGQAPAGNTAILIEMGLKDSKVRDWSGRAVVQGARILHRDGYRFRSEDKLVEPDSWKASSHRAIRAPKGNPVVNKMEPLATVGVVLHLGQVKNNAGLTLELKDGEKAEVPLADILAGKEKKLWNGTARVRLVTAATPIVTDKTEDDFPAAAYGPDGTLWVAYISYTVKEEERRIEPPTLKEQPADFKKYFTPEFAEQLFVKYYRDGKWSQPIPATEPRQDLVRCAIAADKHFVWVVYSAQRNGNFDLYRRSILAVRGEPGALDWSVSKEERLTTAAGPDITPVMCADSRGNTWVACQSWGEDGQARISVIRRDGKGTTRQVIIEGQKGENCWHPAIAADSNGNVAVAYDIYCAGNYDVRVALFDSKGKRTDKVIADSARAEMRPSLAYQGNKLWIAFEEGPENWGKDSGAFALDKGQPLYSQRSVRVLCLDNDGKLHRPAAELPISRVKSPGAQFQPTLTQQYERGIRYAYPKLGVDLKGRLWLAYRESSSSRYSSHPGSYWLTHVRRLEEKSWSEPVEVHHSDGLLDHRPVLLPHPGGGLLVIHNTDGRYTTPEIIDNQIYASAINLPGGEGKPQLVPHAVERKNHEGAAEAAAVKRIKAFRMPYGNKKLQILRGEFHRHTEISWDGGADGSLEDMFRYAIDAAGMDWIGNGDHDSGAGREYPWWLIQKSTDAYHVPGFFTPMFTYERSVSYPHGHRNCMFARRGIRTLPRLAPPKGKKSPGNVHPDDTKMLYRYLKELDGICAMHTSATGMGTDWRDNDSAVEPIVEIYQGDRMSYEMEDAPRAGYDPKTGKKPANIAGWYPKGFINNALQMGHRLGFQASSDHWSTHISYFMVLAENNDRRSIMKAIRKRHTYGATDNIILDVRSGPYILGDEFKTRRAPALQIHVMGTKDLAKVDVLRDSEVVASLKPQGQGYSTAWIDPKPLPGLHYYYIRVLQRDGEIAWASPMWIHYEK